MSEPDGGAFDGALHVDAGFALQGIRSRIGGCALTSPVRVQLQCTSKNSVTPHGLLPFRRPL